MTWSPMVLGAEILYHFDAKVLRFFLFLCLKESFLNDIYREAERGANRGNTSVLREFAQGYVL
ncbi:hypothetical protein [Undibacterium sp.]|uniref:hypothetical protein n=1 Tax=Undibacterium sp. TaxID=1914977 RepID=UPI00272B445E|nr:hypothetical protein [Undibacterium sp.]